MRLRTLAPLALALVAASFLGSISWSLPLRIGAAGDSLTDEYAQYLSQYLTPMPQLFPPNPQPPSPVPAPANWVEQLASTRPGEVDFGATGSFPAPRNAGYAQNWARAGATSATLLSEGGGQHTGLASQALDLVYVGIGTNNFAPIDLPSLGLVNVFGGIYNGCQSLTSCSTPFTGSNSISYTSVEDYVADVLAEISTAVTTIGASGAGVVLGNVADWGDLPSSLASFPIASPGSYTGAAGRQLVSDAVDLLNIGILQLAAANDLPVVDLHALLAAGDGSLPLALGGVAIQPGAPGSRDPQYFFLPDGTHGDTLVQGLLANAFIAAANARYGSGLTPLSDTEILANAGLVPAEDWDGTDFDANAFVAFVPEPSTGLLLVTGLLVLAARRRRGGV